MAKGSKGKKGTRDPSSLTVRLRSRPPLPALRLTENLKAPASGPARLFSGQPAKFSVSPAPRSKGKKLSSFGHAQISFSAPSQTIVCVRRSRRKEVLHALKKTGKRGQRRPRRTAWRDYKC